MNDKLLIAAVAVVALVLIVGVQSTVASSPQLQAQVSQECAAYGGCPGGPSLQPIASVPPVAALAQGGVQKVSIRALSTGLYDNRVVTVKKGMPVELSFSADANAGCGRAFYLDEFDVQLVAKGDGVQTATFTPTKAGTFDYHCGMWMFRGKLIVTN